MAVDVDLEMEMTADGAGVAGLADGADTLPGPDAVAAVDGGRANQVRIEVASVLRLAMDQQVVAVKDGVIAGAQHPPRRHGDQGRAAGGDDVEALMGAAAAAGRSELADRTARPVRALDREDVGLEGDGAVVAGAAGRRGRCGGSEND